MDELSNLLNQINIEKDKGFVTLSQKNKPQLSYEGHFFRLKNAKQDLNVTKNFACRSTCETIGCIIGSSYEVLNYDDDHVDTAKTNELTKKEYKRKKRNRPNVREKLLLRVQPNYPPQPKELKGIEFPDFLKKTLSKNELEAREFILFDSGKEDKDRFFIFCNLEHLHLIEGAHIFFDETFDIAPNLCLAPSKESANL
ncbi:unnamed protein product [Brachionus calyciflorus]|uniref:Uncharacterized protein n=1 Tax=Brachionus calyciflorus TaxID=104777 RepID=A0A813Y2T1_9BILA|nr:unnamed protein product [Brachionus calyciflorus]